MGSSAVEFGPQPVRGYTRVAFRIAWWNVFHLGALVVWGLLLASEQGAELLRIYGGVPGMLLGATLYAGVLAGLSSFMVARGGNAQLQRIVANYGIDLPLVRRLAQVYAPTFMATAPLVMLGMANDRRIWFIAALITAVFGYDIALRYVRSRRDPGPVKPFTWERLSKYWIWIALLIWAIAVAGSGTAISELPELARTVGTLGVSIVSLMAWSTLLSLTLVAVPLRLGLSSLALVAPIVWLLMGYLIDPNRFPRRDLGLAASQLRAAAVTPPFPLELGFLQWLSKFESTPAGERIPVFLVSAEGGGIRAAYWTARVMAELDERSKGEFSRHVFVVSGVSGGSVGVTAFVGSTLSLRNDPRGRTQRLERFLGQDFLSPMVANMLITEPIWQLMGRGVVPRDVGFERQLEADWKAQFGDDFYSRPFLNALSLDGSTDVPAFMINSTNVELGKRVVFSNLALTPASDVYAPFSTVPELRETLADLTVAEVAHLSARFVFVSPPASLVGYVNDASQPPRRVPRVWGRVVDGGYFDNSGGLGIEDALQEMLNRRTDAKRAPVVATNPTPADRGRALLPRVIFHVIVIRNDPLAETDDTPDIPTLRQWVDRPTLPPETVAANLEKSTYAPMMPKGIALSELQGPLDAILAAREARGGQTRASLRKVVNRVASVQQEGCDARTPCQKDQYWEISLSEELSTAARRDPVFAPGLGCTGVALRKDVALGWVLSPGSQALLTCLAKGSRSVDRVLENSRLGRERP